MTMKIYGSPMSRASRVMWCARELGVPFENVEVPFDKIKEPAYLAVNPNGKVPGFVDGDLKLFESLAINLYLAKKYGMGNLYPANGEDEARAFQWTLWGASEVEHLVITALLVKLGFSTDTAGAAAGAEKVKPALKVLDDYLKGRDYLIGKSFSIADLNLSSVLAIALYGGIDLSAYQNLSAWLDRCLKRPARNPASRE